MQFVWSTDANIQELKDGDALLVPDVLSNETDDDMLYNQKIGPEITHQVWNLDDDDVDSDFSSIKSNFP